MPSYAHLASQPHTYDKIAGGHDYNAAFKTSSISFFMLLPCFKADL
jgi:FtsZ-interacting cell division protein ZipA